MSEALTIRKLVDRISSGDIRIPAFQRDFVWEPEQVAFLLDSIYKGFPIGTVIFWRTDKQLNTEKNLGHFTLPSPSKDYPVNYVLDGQQRLTSLFSVFQTDLEPNNDEWTDVYFDMSAIESLQESVFLSLDSDEVDPDRHFPIKTLFDSVEYRKATKELTDEEMIKKIDDLQSKFKEYMIPNEVFETSDRNKVAIVFERINRAGTDLNVFELLSAWSWSEEFDLIEKFKELQDKIADHGFEDLCNDKDLQLKICAGIITGETTPNKILDMQGAIIRERFIEIEAGIIGALDFLKREVKVKHYKMLPFSATLVPLSSFFATTKVEGINYSQKQKQVILKWFWRSLFSRRFSSDVNQRQAHDILEFSKLRDDENYNFILPKSDVKIDFKKSSFSAASANSQTLILLLNSMSPHSFLSGAAIDPATVLKKASKHEFHHIYPVKYLEGQGFDKSSINVLANICFLTRADNNNIKAKSPAIYLSTIDEDKKNQYLNEAICPLDIESLTYDDFLTKRVALLENAAKLLMD